MSYDQKTGVCFCERCGYSWRTKSDFVGHSKRFPEPKSCAKCKSKVWNQPRVYAGKYISGTLARRFKPTGRAATKKIDPEQAEWNRIANDPEKTTSEKLDALLQTLEPEERAAATVQIYLLRLAKMLEEVGIK